MGKRTPDSEKTIKQLKKDVWKWFSLARRLESCYEGYGNCCTCGKLIHYKKGNAGHFRHNVNNTYFLEKNVHLQCIFCNMYCSGKTYEYGRYLDERYGEGTADGLDLLSHKRKTFKKEELIELKEIWKTKAKKLEETNG